MSKNNTRPTAEYYIDSNIFVNAKIRDKKYGDACNSIIMDLINESFNGNTSTLALLEVSNALRKIGLAGEISNELNAIYSTPIILHELLNIDIRLMMDLFAASNVNPYDCAHAAIMKRIGLKNIISTDPHFDQISGIVRLDPSRY